MIKGAPGWFVTILGLFIISIGLVLVYRMRLNYENKNSKLETLVVQSVSYGVLLTVLGILVFYYWDLIASPTCARAPTRSTHIFTYADWCRLKGFNYSPKKYKREEVTLYSN